MNNSNNYRKTSKPFTPENISYSQYLMRHIGRTVIIEYTAAAASKEIFGCLIKAGDDFVAVKLPCSPVSAIVINTNCISKITIIFEEK